MAASSSPRRTLRASGSKVITDPVQLGPDLLQFSLDGGALGHGGIVASALADVAEADRRNAPFGDQLSLVFLACDAAPLAKEKRLPREGATDEPVIQRAEHGLRRVQVVGVLGPPGAGGG